uniref:Phospholipase B1, membrane-associated n=1 Tax=Acrobeloides nanus TaxID=290746 RepID=A0A914C6N6_9BILA
MSRSKVRPTNVNALRPADISVVMALGDSLTAANGARAGDMVGILRQYRGLSFSMGGDMDLDHHITIPNILRKYNPKLFGYSRGIGPSHLWNASRFNMATPGAKARLLPQQAQRLLRVLKEHNDSIDIKNDWKLLNIFVGGNDLCAYCTNETEFSAENYVSNIKKAIHIIKSTVPRVLVNLVTMFNIDLVRQLDLANSKCQGLHLVECSCEKNKTFTNSHMRAISNAYQIEQKKLEKSGIFDSDDFALVTQPFFRDVFEAPKLSNGSINLEFFAPDCFHLSQTGHAVVASWIWKNMLEPVGKKTTNANLNNASLPLPCPDPACPFIRTVKNSKNCKKYLAPTVKKNKNSFNFLTNFFAKSVL